MVATVSLLWGSSYLWIAIGLESFPPAVLAWLRLLFGVAMLATLSRKMVRIKRADWAGVAIIGLVGNGAPALLFALAEQRVESAVVGMITGATPILTFILALAIGTKSLRRIHGVGLVLGFAGIVMMSAPNMTGSEASAIGMLYVFLAVLSYTITSIVIGPLQKKYGGVALILAAQTLALFAMTPYAATQAHLSTFTARSFGALVILGLLGTGVARAMFANLIGRAGAARAQVVGYLVPVTAVILGVVVLSEDVSTLEIFGLLIVLVGAFLTSRASATGAGSPG